MNSCCGSNGALPSGRTPKRSFEDVGVVAKQRVDFLVRARCRTRLPSCAASRRRRRCFRRNAVGVFGRIEAAAGVGHLARDVLQRVLRDFAKNGSPDDLRRFEVREHELRLVVEHLLEVRHAPVAVDRIAMEAAADVIAHAAERHRAQRRAAPCRAPRRRRCARARAAGTAARSAAGTSARRQNRRGARSKTAGTAASVCVSASSPGTSRAPSWPRAIAAAQPLDDLCRRLHDLARARRARRARSRASTSTKPGPAPLRRGREVGAAVERLQLGRQPHAHRPAAGSGGRLHERHVDAIDVGPLFAIDFDRHELLVQDFGDRRRSRTTRAP